MLSSIEYFVLNNSTKDSVLLRFHVNNVYVSTAQCYITDSS